MGLEASLLRPGERGHGSGLRGGARTALVRASMGNGGRRRARGGSMGRGRGRLAADSGDLAGLELGRRRDLPAGAQRHQPEAGLTEGSRSHGRLVFGFQPRAGDRAGRRTQHNQAQRAADVNHGELCAAFERGMPLECGVNSAPAIPQSALRNPHWSAGSGLALGRGGVAYSGPLRCSNYCARIRRRRRAWGG